MQKASEHYDYVDYPNLIHNNRRLKGIFYFDQNLLVCKPNPLNCCHHRPSILLNQQGADKGTQYRSAIFYQNDAEKQYANSYCKELVSKGTFKVVTTEVVPFTIFYAAESYHQDYEKKNPNNGYIQAVSKPRMLAFKKKTKLLLHE